MTLTIDTGFTISDQVAHSPGNYYGSGLGYLVQGSAGAINPTWTISGAATAAGAVIASFIADPATTSFSQGHIYG
jgi:hypothetical protein